jgi:hypothetical protein
LLVGLYFREQAPDLGCLLSSHAATVIEGNRIIRHDLDHRSGFLAAGEASLWKVPCSGEGVRRGSRRSRLSMRKRMASAARAKRLYPTGPRRDRFDLLMSSSAPAQ